MGGPSGGSGSSTTTATIAPQLEALFEQTGGLLKSLQTFRPPTQGPGFSFNNQVGIGFNPLAGVGGATGFTAQPALFQQFTPSAPAPAIAPPEFPRPARASSFNTGFLAASMAA